MKTVKVKCDNNDCKFNKKLLCNSDTIEFSNWYSSMDYPVCKTYTEIEKGE